ncbi:efflux pump protein [Melanomma pulvis-pyrius CBS 109.77]|uniref:Efflux pump protein n=1 Tax=Melanomma pulvis-pyrius CBS 109.77 TaxID=1314802 RepID=A0A6A6XFI1_9PLEO|nr:efflux pump protein [Melanomma pulvis-pyrius CBS 109.77]
MKLLGAVGSVTLACFLLLLDQSILATATPVITSKFHSLPDVGWYAGAYQLANASLQPLTGKIYTYFSAKSTFLIFFFIFELGSLLCGVANSSSMLIGGRAIAGIGASGLMNGGMTIISGAVPLHKRPIYTGVILGFAQLGIILGPLIGGALTEYTSWRWCFFINLPIGGLVAILLFIIEIPDLTVKEPFSLALVRKVLPELDLFGFSLFAPAAVMFLLAIQFGGDNSHPWNSSVVIGLFCGAGVTAILFVAWEIRRGDRAMIPGPIVRQRIVWSSTGQGAFLMASIFIASYFMPIYFQAVKGVGPTMSGVYLLPSILTSLLFVLVSGAAISKLGYYLPWALFSGGIMAIGSGLVSTFSPSTTTGEWIGYQIILGAGRGPGMQVGMIAIQNTLRADQIPVSIAFLIFAQSFAGAISIVIATTIFTQSLTTSLGKYAPSVSAQQALAAGGGAQAIRALVPEGSNELAGVLRAYSKSVDHVFYLLVGFALVSFTFSWGMGWKDIRKKKDVPKADEKTEGGETV